MQQILLKNITTGKQIIIQPQTVLTDNLDQRLPNKSGTLQTETDLNTALNGYVNNLSTPTPVVDKYNVSGLEGSTITVNITNYISTNIYYINIGNVDVCSASIKNSVITIVLATVQANSATSITITANSSGKTQSSNCIITVINNIVPTTTDTTLTWVNGVDNDNSSDVNVILTDIANQGTAEGDWLTYQDSVEVALTNNIFVNDDGSAVTISSQLSNGDVVTTGNNDSYTVGDVTTVNTNHYTGYPCVYDCNADIEHINILKVTNTNVSDAGVKNNNYTNIGYSGPGYGAVYFRTATRIYAIGGLSDYKRADSSGNMTTGTVLTTSYYKVLNSDGSIPSGVWIDDTAKTGIAGGISLAKAIVIKNNVIIAGGNSLSAINQTVYKAVIDNTGAISSWISFYTIPNLLKAVSVSYTLNYLYIAGYTETQADVLQLSNSTRVAYLYKIGFDSNFSVNSTGTIVIPPVPVSVSPNGSQYLSYAGSILNIFHNKDRMYLLITSSLGVNGNVNYLNETVTLYYSAIAADGSLGSFISSGLTITLNTYIGFSANSYSSTYSRVIDSIHSENIVTANVVYINFDMSMLYLGGVGGIPDYAYATYMLKIPLDSNSHPTGISVLLNPYKPSNYFGNYFVTLNNIYKITGKGDALATAAFDGWDSNFNNNLSNIVNYTFLKSATTPAINTLVNKLYQLPKLQVLTAVTSAGIATAAAVMDTISNVVTNSSTATVNYVIDTISSGFRSMQHKLTINNANSVINKISTVMTKRQDNTGNATSGNQIFTISGTFTVPNNVTTLNIIMCGGGGGGSTTSNKGAGGGYAGQVTTTTQTVNPGDNYSVNIGNGGAGAIATAYTVGEQGTSTTLYHGAILVSTATGGLPGTLNSSVAGPTAVTPYSGNGEASTTPLGTGRNGYADTSVAYLGGGQSSGYANGGDAGGGNGGIGSGGAGNIYQAGKAGDGGNGICIISW